MNQQIQEDPLQIRKAFETGACFHMACIGMKYVKIISIEALGKKLQIHNLYVIEVEKK